MRVWAALRLTHRVLLLKFTLASPQKLLVVLSILGHAASVGAVEQLLVWRLFEIKSWLPGVEKEKKRTSERKTASKQASERR